LVLSNWSAILRADFGSFFRPNGEEYDPGMPDRQFRASAYMVDHRLYVTKADSGPGDFAALQFEQSVSLIDALGTDLDKNRALPLRQSNCRK
jgi:hypothetical protein